MRARAEARSRMSSARSRGRSMAASARRSMSLGRTQMSRRHTNKEETRGDSHKWLYAPHVAHVQREAANQLRAHGGVSRTTFQRVPRRRSGRVQRQPRPGRVQRRARREQVGLLEQLRRREWWLWRQRGPRAGHKHHAKHVADNAQRHGRRLQGGEHFHDTTLSLRSPAPRVALLRRCWCCSG